MLGSPLPFAEAVANLAGKGLLPTSLSSGDLRQISAGIRRQSVFSARTTLSGYLQEIQDVVRSVIDPKQGPSPDGALNEDGSPRITTQGFNPASAREALRSKLRDLGYAPGAKDEGSIKDLSSSARINLVVKTNAELAQGAGKYIQGNANEDVIDLWPAWELVRYEARNVERDWKLRWSIAAQVAGDAQAAGAAGRGRMVALKSSGIWQALGDGAGGFLDTLGNPYPPFAFQSGMWCEDVSREEATDLGLIEEGEAVRGAALDLEGLFGGEETA